MIWNFIRARRIYYYIHQFYIFVHCCMHPYYYITFTYLFIAAWAQEVLVLWYTKGIEFFAAIVWLSLTWSLQTKHLFEAEDYHQVHDTKRSGWHAFINNFIGKKRKVFLSILRWTWNYYNIISYELKAEDEM